MRNRRGRAYLQVFLKSHREGGAIGSFDIQIDVTIATESPVRPAVRVEANQAEIARPQVTVWATGRMMVSGLPADTTAAQPIPWLSLAPNAWLLTDTDGDGLPAWREYLAGLDPLSRDTNGNGLSDLIDLRRQSQSTNPDDDGDGVANAIENAIGSDPFRADTDGDGVSDKLDDYPLDPTRTQKPAPNPADTTPPARARGNDCRASRAGGVLGSAGPPRDRSLTFAARRGRIV